MARVTGPLQPQSNLSQPDRLLMKLTANSLQPTKQESAALTGNVILVSANRLR